MLFQKRVEYIDGSHATSLPLFFSLRVTGNDLTTAFTPFHHLPFHHFPISINHLVKLVRVIESLQEKIIPQRFIIAKEIVFTRIREIGNLRRRKETRGDTRDLLNNLEEKFLINRTWFDGTKERRWPADEALGRRGLLKPIWFHEAPQVSRNVMQVSRQDREDCGKEEVTGPTIGTVYSESRDHRARDAKVLFEKGKEREREIERKKPRQPFIHASAHSRLCTRIRNEVYPEMSFFRDEFLRFRRSRSGIDARERERSSSPIAAY